MPSIKEFREQFLGMNKLPITQRVDLGKLMQQWVMENMCRGIQFESHLFLDWKETGLKEDKNLKRDAFAILDGRRITAQLKARQPDSGSDIGVATIQPKPPLEDIAMKIKQEGFAFNSESDPKMWARDVRFDGELFLCLENPSWEQVAVIPAQEVLIPTVKTVLMEWLDTWEDLDNMSRGKNTFYSQKCRGIQLKCHNDAGTGWDSKKTKINTYIPANFFTKDQITFIEMEPPSDSLMNDAVRLRGMTSTFTKYFKDKK